jgi:hypothetical protein
LCSLERCFVYYLKIQATESSDISQKRVHTNTVTNILSFFITIFRSFSTFTLKFQVFLEKTYWCPWRSAAQLEFRTPWFFTFFQSELPVTPFRTPCMFFMSEGRKRAFRQGDPNEKLVPNVSFPKLRIWFYYKYWFHRIAFFV